MTHSDLKTRVLEGIENTRNTDLLEEILRLLDLESQYLKVYELNEAQTNAINKSREQIEKGQTLTNEEAIDEIDKWLKR